MAARTTKANSGTLTINAVRGRDSGTVTVESPAFADGDEIPDAHSDYGDGLSMERLATSGRVHRQTTVRIITISRSFVSTHRSTLVPAPIAIS